MQIHLVTYATPRFRLRQRILGLSARVNKVADTVTHWTPQTLRAAGFEERCKGIRLNERGSGFWAWKPFIIDEKLRKVPDGDIVYYCDVGRRYPFKTLEQSIAPFVRWMHSEHQDVLPGLHIPWKGPMSMWTKRAAFMAAGLDDILTHQSAPIQASFSLWIAGEPARNLCKDWLELCSRPFLINDEPSPTPETDLPDYFENRHDQSLLSLCCIRKGVKGLNLGSRLPAIDTQHPDEVMRVMYTDLPSTRRLGRIFRTCITPFALAEGLIRRRLKFGHERPEPDYKTSAPESYTHEGKETASK